MIDVSKYEHSDFRLFLIRTESDTKKSLVSSSDFKEKLEECYSDIEIGDKINVEVLYVGRDLLYHKFDKTFCIIKYEQKESVLDIADMIINCM